MGLFDNIGSTFLDVNRGMREEELNQQRNIDWTRGQKRADSQDKLDAMQIKRSEWGIEDLDRTRTNDSRNRAAFKTGGYDAMEAQAKEAGDPKSAQQAATDRVAALKQRISERELEADEKTLPDRVATAGINAKGALERAPRENVVAGAQTDAKFKDLADRQTLDLLKLAVYDPQSAVAGYNNSKLVEPGNKLTDAKFDPQAKAITLTGTDGKSRVVTLQQVFELDQRLNPPKTQVVPAGATLAETGKNGTRAVFTAPSAEKDTRPLAVTGETTGFYDPKTRSVTPVGNGQGGMPPAKMDARVQKMNDTIDQQNNGELDRLGKYAIPKGNAPRVLRQKVIGEQLVKGGMDPQAAANQAIQQETKEFDDKVRATKGAGMGGIPGPTSKNGELDTIRNLWTAPPTITMPQ